jgi:glucokinase
MPGDGVRYAVGIDVGVTNIKSACIAEDGEVLSRGMTPTGADDPEWPGRVARLVERIAGERGGPPAWAGIAAPGIARPDGRSIGWMEGRLDQVEGLDWAKFLPLGLRVPVLNDAQAALLGEAWRGAAAGARDAVLLTLGTGVGGAVLSDGRLLKGKVGRAGHLGHICLDVDGAPDIVGTPGSLENAVGNTTVRERTGGRFATTHELVAAHLAGDPDATTAWLRSIRALACAVTSFINVLDPEVVVIGGGIAAAGPALFGPLERHLDALEWRPHGHRVLVRPALLGDFAGALGAAWNARQEGEGSE